MEKISVLFLVLLTNFLFCHPYVTMPNVSLRPQLHDTGFVSERYQF